MLAVGLCLLVVAFAGFRKPSALLRSPHQIPTSLAVLAEDIGVQNSSVEMGYLFPGRDVLAKESGVLCGIFSLALQSSCGRYELWERDGIQKNIHVTLNRIGYYHFAFGRFDSDVCCTQVEELIFGGRLVVLLSFFNRCISAIRAAFKPNAFDLHRQPTPFLADKQFNAVSGCFSGCLRRSRRGQRYLVLSPHQIGLALYRRESFLHRGSLESHLVSLSVHFSKREYSRDDTRQSDDYEAQVGRILWRNQTLEVILRILMGVITLYGGAALLYFAEGRTRRKNWAMSLCGCVLIAVGFGSLFLPFYWQPYCQQNPYCQPPKHGKNVSRKLLTPSCSRITVIT